MDAARKTVSKTIYMAAQPRNAKAYRPTMQFRITQSKLGLWSKFEVLPYETPAPRLPFRFDELKFRT